MDDDDDDSDYDSDFDLDSDKESESDWDSDTQSDFDDSELESQSDDENEAGDGRRRDDENNRNTNAIANIQAIPTAWRVKFQNRIYLRLVGVDVGELYTVVCCIRHFDENTNDYTLESIVYLSGKCSNMLRQLHEHTSHMNDLRKKYVDAEKMLRLQCLKINGFVPTKKNPDEFL